MIFQYFINHARHGEKAKSGGDHGCRAEAVGAIHGRRNCTAFSHFWKNRRLRGEHRIHTEFALRILTKIKILA